MKPGLATTKFMTLELPLPPAPNQLLPLIYQELTKVGTPLRWAITELPRPGVIRVEAVVTPMAIDADSSQPL